MTNSEDQRLILRESIEGQLVMPCWYFEKEDLRNTPSIQDGLDYATELRYRHECSKFIITCGTKLRLRCDTFATGVVFFHRFYMFHSFKSFPRYVTAACCLLLAGKIEETPKKCRDIVKVARSVLNDHQFNQFGQDPREEVMSLERVLLKTIKFDLQADHPYRHLLNYGKKIRGDMEKIQQMIQMAWTFTNDSLCTTLCLQWEPEIVACALLYLATKLSKFEIEDWENKGRSTSPKKWWEHFVAGMSLEVMEDICHQILDLYSKPSGGAGLPTGSGVPSASLPTPTSTSETSSNSSRRKRKADSSFSGSASNVSESIGVQAGSGRSGRSSRGSAIPSTVPPVSSMSGYQMQSQASAAGLSYGSYTDPAGIAALANAATAGMPPDQASQYYAIFARQQQAAAAAAAAVYGGASGTHGATSSSYASSGQGYGQAQSSGNYSNQSGNQVRMPASGKMSGSGNQGGQSSLNFVNPSVRITQRR